MSIKELKERREKLVRANRKEYTTMGNTQRCQELFAEIEKIDDMLQSECKKNGLPK